MESCHHSDGAPKVNKAPPKPSRSRESRGSRGSREAELGDAPLLSALVTSTRTSESDPTDPLTGPGPLETSMCACWRCKSWSLDPIGLGSAVKGLRFIRKTSPKKRTGFGRKKMLKVIIIIIQTFCVQFVHFLWFYTNFKALNQFLLRFTQVGVAPGLAVWTSQRRDGQSRRYQATHHNSSRAESQSQLSLGST